MSLLQRSDGKHVYHINRFEQICHLIKKINREWAKFGLYDKKSGKTKGFLIYKKCKRRECLRF